MTYFVLAGEASGDMHAARLIEELRKKNPQACFVGMGGDKMRQAGCQLIQHYREMAYMGFVAVIRNLGKIRHNFDLAYDALKREKPDAVILIDYPSFNLKIAQWVRKNLPGTRIYYYIPPKIWAWKTWRVHRIATLSDKILGIFPFEPEWYRKYGYECAYVGNPTMDAIRTYRESHHSAERQDIIAILPGSRRSEVEHCLGKMVEAASRYPNYRIEVAKAPGLEPEVYAPYLNGATLVEGTYDLLGRAKAAIVNSGTATLETALMDCPQVTVYHIALGRLAGLVRPFVFKTPWFTLVNIIPQKTVAQELLAYLFTVENVANELGRLLEDEEYRHAMLNDYASIRDLLGNQPAAMRAAEMITEN